MKRTIRTTVLAVGVLIDLFGSAGTRMPAAVTERTAHSPDN
ncbi:MULTISPECIES: hypothetical protein [unclassified Streptomyces]